MKQPSVLLATANENEVRWMREGLAELLLLVRPLEGDELSTSRGTGPPARRTPG